jgi:lipopolysaccharide biosynthesis glycosyltransferase
MSAKETIHIVFTINDAYVKYFAVCLTSILESAGDERFVFYVISDDLTEYSRKRILELKSVKDFELEFIDFDNKMLDGIKEQQYSYISIHSAYRLKLASLLPNINKVIYLDADLVVLKSLKELWNTNISGYYIACAVDPAMKIGRFGDLQSSLKLPKSHRYVNAGVCLINLQKWREDDLEKRFFSVSKEFNERLKFPEQDILNIACAGEILHLHNLWNAIPTLDNAETEESFRNPSIVHYAGGEKPWAYRDVPFAHLFWKYARKTSYYEELLLKYCEKVTSRTIQDTKIFYRKFIKYKILQFFTFGKIEKINQKKNIYAEKLNVHSQI